MSNAEPERFRGPVWTIVVAGGTGRRFGSLKQYARIDGRRVLDLSVEAARSATDGVVLVVPADDAEREGGVAGGPTRTASVRNGLAAVPPEAEIVLVHDAARPWASVELFRSVIDAVRSGADGAVPGLPVTDTVKVIEVVESSSVGLSSHDGAPAVVPRVVTTPDRATLIAVQTPQAFRAAVLRRAYEAPSEGTDDASLVEAIGGTVVVVPGEVTNLKITTPDDLARGTGVARG